MNVNRGSKPDGTSLFNAGFRRTTSRFAERHGPASFSPMSEPILHILAVVGSPRANSITRVALRQLATDLEQLGCAVDVLDLGEMQLAPYNPETSYASSDFPALKERVHRADVVILGSPDYHGSISSTLKNFLDHFWKEFAGKLFANVVASHEKGLTTHDQLRTVARQCYAWALPYGVSLQEKVDVNDGQVVSGALQERLEMMARDVAVYGRLLAKQRKADLIGSDPGFLAHHRA
jgi:FMN reductase